MVNERKRVKNPNKALLPKQSTSQLRCPSPNYYSHLGQFRPNMRISQEAQNNDPNDKKSNNKSANFTKVALNPYTSQTLYLMKKARDQQPKSAVVLSDGMTYDQWHQIHQFEIIGQSQTKKKNYNVALDHFFNLRSMYKKINDIKFKNAVPIRLHNNNEETPVEQLTRKKNEAKKKAKSMERIKISAFPNQENEKTVNQNIKNKKESVKKNKLKLENVEEKKATVEVPKKSKEKIKPSKKVQKKSKKIDGSLGQDPLEDFRNTNEEEMIAANIHLAGLPKREVDLKEMMAQQKQKKRDDPPGKIPKEKTDHNQKTHSTQKQQARLMESEVIHRKVERAQKATQNNDEENEDEIPILFEESNRKKTAQSSKKKNDTDYFEMGDLAEKMRKAETEEEEQQREDDEDDIMDKIPTLDDETEEKLGEFKQQLVETIINYEILNEEEFENFFEAVCMKNEQVPREFLTQVFEEVKVYLYEQFQNLDKNEEE